MYSIVNIVDALAPFLKETHYKKRNLTWIKESNLIVIVFAIRKSQFGASKWYYEFGIGLKDISTKNIAAISSCHIRFQIENTIDKKEISAEILTELIKKWETMYGSIEKLRLCALKGKLPPLSSREAITYLTSVDLSKFLMT